MNYIIAIPSYKRATQLQNKTLATLHRFGIEKEKINVFVVEEEYEEYLETLDKNYYNELIIGKRGLVEQRHFIRHYYEENTNIINIDDDIQDIDLSFTNYNSLNDFIIDAFNICISKKAFIWGIYPVYNPYFRKTKTPITTDLRYIVGAFYGFINRHSEDLDLQICKNGDKEDVENTILYWLKDKIIIRFNQIGFKTKYFGVGGLGGLKERLEEHKIKTIELNEKYSELTKIKIRKTGLYEIVFRPGTKLFSCKKPNMNVKSFVDEPYYLDKLDTNREDIKEILELLGKKMVPILRGQRGRARTFGEHRGMVLGLIKGRVTRKYELSYQSKKNMKLYEKLMEFGKSFVPFDFTSIQVNHNVVCPRHIDPYNNSASCIVSIGDYQGCDLSIELDENEIKTYNTNCHPLVFDGSKNYHFNTPLISGDKYSFVFFNNPGAP